MPVVTLAVSVCLWCLVVYSLRVALLGNPLYLSVLAAGQDLRFRADQIVMEGRSPANEAEILFMRRFSRLTVLELVAITGEVAVIVYLLWGGILAWLCWFLLAKNAGMIAFSVAMAKSRHAQKGMFETLRGLPGWYIWLDRLSAGVTAVGLLLAFLAVNHIGRLR